MSSAYSNQMNQIPRLLQSDHLPDTGIIASSISNVLSSAPSNGLSVATANHFSYGQTPHTRVSRNSSSTSTIKCIPPAGRLPSTHHEYNITNSLSMSLSRNTNVQSHGNQSLSNHGSSNQSSSSLSSISQSSSSQSYNDQSYNDQSYNPQGSNTLTLTHPSQLFSFPHHSPPPSLHIPQAQNAPPRLYAQPSHNPPHIIFSQRGRYPAPGLHTQRGQYPPELHEAWYHRDSQHGCPGCVHEALCPQACSRYHWPACPISGTRAMAAWM
ncbi:hypothetical protein G6011_08303 [Alternaria panax]|uniref:Uncharacterized protein n=1 Tax=Alternaria panax TaxID=48097 RepID=A0AAD4I600_9PLEO|nr:hypothetical protein G6011_08303 [Alternaria panax]